MDNNSQQPNVRRRLSFEELDEPMPTTSYVQGNRLTGDTPLSGLRGTESSDWTLSDQETDTEGSPRTPERIEMAGLRVLYQGYDRPRAVARPRAGFAVIVARERDGLTTVYNLPLRNVHLAFTDDEETESEGDINGNEEDD